jgi:hypothetical protein
MNIHTNTFAMRKCSSSPFGENINDIKVVNKITMNSVTVNTVILSIAIVSFNAVINIRLKRIEVIPANKFIV